MCRAVSADTPFSVQKKPFESANNEYIAHQVCPRCRLILSQDLCVCGWQRPRPEVAKKQSDWVLRVMALAVVGGVLWWIIAQVLPGKA